MLKTSVLEECVLCQGNAQENGFCTDCVKDINEDYAPYDALDEALATYMIEDAQLASTPCKPCSLIVEMQQFIDDLPF